MYYRWWGGGKCEAFKSTSTSHTKELDMSHVLGVFLVLAGGMALAVTACIIEVIVRRQREMQAKTKQVNLHAMYTPTSSCFIR